MKKTKLYSIIILVIVSYFKTLTGVTGQISWGEVLPNYPITQLPDLGCFHPIVGRTQQMPLFG